MRYKIKIRTPDDYEKGVAKRFTAEAEGQVGDDYQYVTEGFAVYLEFDSPNVKPWPNYSPEKLSLPRAVPKPSQTKKTRGKKTIDEQHD